MKKTIISIFTAWILTGIIVFGGIAEAVPGVITEVYAAQAETKITILVDGKPVSFSEEPRLIDGNAMVSVREIGEALGWEVRLKTAEVFELAKASVYTDGSRKYLFSSHTITFNLKNGWFNRNIMVGVGHFLDTANDHNIKLKVTPIVVNGVIYISVRDLAVSLYADVGWNGETKTVSIISGVIPYYDGQGLTNREELFQEMRKYNKINGALTKLSGESSTAEPVKPAETESPATKLSFTPTGIMTAVPKVGSVPAKILLPDKTDIKSADSYREPYKNYISSGCNWYSFGRLYETTGIWIPAKYQFGTRGGLKDVESANLDYVKVERNINNVVSGCVAIFVGKTEDYTGHSVFVEYVEYDNNGKPVHIYYTDSNYSHTGYFAPSMDAKVVKVSFEKFANLYQAKVFDGYMIPVQ